MNKAIASTILVSDDNKVIDAVGKYSQELGFTIVTFKDAEEAKLSILQNPAGVSTILIDSNLNKDNCLALLRALQFSAETKIIPVITITNDLDTINDHTKAGALYAVDSLDDSKTFNIMMSAAMADFHRHLKAVHNVTSLPCTGSTVQNMEFSFHNLREADIIANMLAEACPNPRLAVVGFNEILINAVEHGNLGITYNEKSELQNTKEWLPEIQRRMELPENKNKKVRVKFNREQNQISVRIIDEGEGFEWDKYMSFDVKRSKDTHGRGIIMAKSLAFAGLKYHGKGNEVECIIKV